MSASGARYRHAFRQGRLSGQGLRLYVIPPEEFPKGSSFEAFRDAAPSSEGAQVLRDQVLTDVTISIMVSRLGLPAAIGFASSTAGQEQRLALFYRTPPRSLVFQRSSMSVQWLSLSQLYESRMVADLPTVPRTVQRLAFHEGPLIPPWPTTIPPECRDAFAVPPKPAAPPGRVEGQAYVAVADDLISRLPPSVNSLNKQRAEAALARIEPVVHKKGLAWQVVVFGAGGPMGFGVPNGILFVSDGLVQALDDSELAAVIAHLMGHELYQHARASARRRDLLAVSSFLGGAFQIAGGGAGIFLIPTGGYLALIAHPQFGYRQTDEIEANAAAAMLLSGANIAPEVLFDAMVKLSIGGQPGSLSYDRLHHLPVAALQYGLMLDAGLKFDPMVTSVAAGQEARTDRVEFQEMSFTLPAGQWKRSEDSQRQVTFTRSDGQGRAQSISVWRVEFPPELYGLSRAEHTRNMWEHERLKPRPFGHPWTFAETEHRIGDRPYDVMTYSLDESGTSGFTGEGMFVAYFPDDFERRRAFYMLMWFELRPSDEPSQGMNEFEAVVSSFHATQIQR